MAEGGLDKCMRKKLIQASENYIRLLENGTDLFISELLVSYDSLSFAHPFVEFLDDDVTVCPAVSKKDHIQARIAQTKILLKALKTGQLTTTVLSIECLEQTLERDMDMLKCRRFQLESSLECRSYRHAPTPMFASSLVRPYPLRFAKNDIRHQQKLAIKMHQRAIKENQRALYRLVPYNFHEHYANVRLCKKLIRASQNYIFLLEEGIDTFVRGLFVSFDSLSFAHPSSVESTEERQKELEMVLARLESKELSVVVSFRSS